MLPNGVEPLQLADGTLINPEDGSIVSTEVQTFIEVPNVEEIQEELVATRKRLSELPLPINKMNVLSIIMCYTIYGIEDYEIAQTVGITEEQVIKIKMSEAYMSMQSDIFESIRQSTEVGVRGYLEQQSKLAANKVVSMLNSSNEDRQLNAAKDILDRTGHRPIDRIEHLHKYEGGLRIEYIDKTKESEIPTIDLEATEF